ncbi:hypothetical protein [Aurantibacter sp.]|uniref:hypothetical protein n=1 Tax=Aurantibacter sp. TaxID=2807103 RepID=UPI0035C876C4
MIVIYLFFFVVLFLFIREKNIIKSKIEKDFETLRENSFEHSENKNNLISKKKEIYFKKKSLQILNFAMFFVVIIVIIQIVFGSENPFFWIYTIAIGSLVRYVNSGEVSYELEKRAEANGFVDKVERLLLLFVINLYKKPPLLITILCLLIIGFVLLFFSFILNPLLEDVIKSLV